MNFLQLVQRLHTETGASGTPPQAVTGNTNQNAQLVTWINGAWLEIQSKRRWDFLRRTKSVALTVGTGTYDIAQNLTGIPGFSWTDLQDLDIDNSIVTKPDGSKYRLEHLEFREFSERFDLAPIKNAYPQWMSIIPGFKMQFYPTPDLIYGIRFVYYAAPQQLVLPADIPYMSDTSVNQDADHMILVWKALEYYADHNNIPDFKQAASMKYDLILSRLMWRDLPTVKYKEAPVV